MLECRFEKLPLQTLTQRGFLTQSSGFQDYVSCYNARKGNFSKQPCFEEVSVCGKSAEESVKHACPVLSSAAKTVIETGDLASANKQIKAALLQEGVTITKSVTEMIKSFGKRALCLSKVQNAIQPCLGIAVERCRNSSLRVLEINRMKMEDMDFIIRAFPNLNYIYYTRDPRGISLSRARDPKVHAITKAKLICQRMQRDVVEFRQLERKYPGLIHHVRYEDFVTTPIAKSVEVYRLFGDSPPPQWENLAEQNMHYKKKVKYHVKNATETASRWKREIPAEDLREMDSLCGDVLDALGYPRYQSIN